jgi:molecular chaperone GrpE (heat shock protein)
MRDSEPQAGDEDVTSATIEQLQRALADEQQRSRHEAVATVRADEIRTGTVAREVRRGWRLGSELLRAAQVVVARGREDADPWR